MNLRNLLTVRLTISVASLAVLLLAASCTSGTEGIFASIEREQKIISLGGLNKYATVDHMAESTSLKLYFATGGRSLFSKSTSTGVTAWTNSTVGGSSFVLAVGVTGTGTSGDRVWAVAGGTLYQSADGSTWTPQTLSGGETPVDLVPIRAADGYSTTQLLVITSLSGAFSKVYRIDATGASTPLTLTATAAGSATAVVPGTGVISAATDGTNYYLASESFLWKWDGVATTNAALSVSVPQTGYGGLIDQGGVLYLGTRSATGSTTGGGLYTVAVTGTTATFTSITTGVKNANGYYVSFGQWLFNTGNNDLWIATGPTTTTEGTGYMELSGGTNLSVTPNTNTNNYSSSGIPTYAVGTLFRGSDGTYFLGTIAHGLWTWSGTGSSGMWSQQ